jgi:hypothetical protein
MPTTTLFPKVRLRLLAFALGVSSLAAACSHGPNQLQSFVTATTQGVPKLTITGIGQGGGIGETPSNPIQVGHAVTISFGLEDPSGKPITSGTPNVYITKEGDVVPYGPTPATWSPFRGYQSTGDHSPPPPIQGVWYATVPMPTFAGVATIVVYAPGGRQNGVGVTHAFVEVKPEAARIGSKAVPVKTPVATGGNALRAICTRTPPDDMHGMSLDAALENGKPTMLIFSSPGSSSNNLDAAVTDEMLLTKQKYGSRVNFVHVDSSKNPGAVTAWKFPAGSGPWVVVVDKKGVIANRFSGATTAPMIELALKNVLHPSK